MSFRPGVKLDPSQVKVRQPAPRRTVVPKAGNTTPKTFTQSKAPKAPTSVSRGPRAV